MCLAYVCRVEVCRADVVWFMCAELMLAELTVLMLAELNDFSDSDIIEGTPSKGNLSKHHADARDDFTKIDPNTKRKCSQNKFQFVSKCGRHVVQIRSKIGQNSIQNRSKINQKSSKLGLWGSLGASWAHLGAQVGLKIDFWTILGALLGSCWGHLSIKIRTFVHVTFLIDFRLIFDRFWS